MAEATLHVCVTCGHPDEPRPGRLLHDRIAAAMEAGEPFALNPVTCLARCGQGCSIAATGAGKWGYLMSGLGPEHAADLLTYARAYAAHPSGALLPSRRPESLRHTVVGRIPSLETAA